MLKLALSANTNSPFINSLILGVELHFSVSPMIFLQTHLENSVTNYVTPQTLTVTNYTLNLHTPNTQD